MIIFAVCLHIGQGRRGYGAKLGDSSPVLLVGDQEPWGAQEDLGRIYNVSAGPEYKWEPRYYIWAGYIPLEEWEKVLPYLAQSCRRFSEDYIPTPNWNHPVVWLDKTSHVTNPKLSKWRRHWRAGNKLLL